MRRMPIPEDVTGQEIDKSVRQELQSLPKTLADDVARNLVMVARLLDEEPEEAYGYAKVAFRLASRVAAVREAMGFAAYANAKYSEALAEFRAARRMTGSVELWPVMADCERGLGRPERTLAMAGEPEVGRLDRAGQVEMRLVAAGARKDMGQAEAAVVTLQSPELASSTVHPWTARLRYAYADALLEAGREDEAREWFGKALEADQSGTTDASDRLAELDGVEFLDALDPGSEEDGSADAAPAVAPEPAAEVRSSADPEPLAGPEPAADPGPAPAAGRSADAARAADPGGDVETERNESAGPTPSDFLADPFGTSVAGGPPAAAGDGDRDDEPSGDDSARRDDAAGD